MENTKNTENCEEKMDNQDQECPCCNLETDQQENAQQKPALEEELAHVRDQWLRSIAESENLRRRFQKEKEDALKYSALSFAKDMIAIADSIDQALKSMQAASQNELILPFFDGLKMTAQEINNVFSRQGIKKVDPENKKFDPNLHQAMMEVETSDHEPGTIVQILQDGYVMHDRLLRPSLVSVARKG
ncbi:MAG: Protein GrpE [Holosporales bacterium]